MGSTDPTGLIINNMFSTYKMSQKPWGSTRINNVPDTSLTESGCAITLIANMVAMISRSNINPSVLNNNSANFSSINLDELSWAEAGRNAGLTVSRSKSYGSIASQIAAAQKLLHEAELSPEKMYVGVYVPITLNDGTVKYHWVGVDGASMIDYDGLKYLKVSATSTNDKSNRESNPNWKEIDGDMYVRADSVQGTVTANNSNPENPSLDDDDNKPSFGDSVKAVINAIVSFFTGSDKGK